MKEARREHLARLADVREAIAAIRAHVGRGELDDSLVFDAATVADDLPVLEAAIARMQFRVDDAT